jgi:hypothetical protein
MIIMLFTFGRWAELVLSDGSGKSVKVGLFLRLHLEDCHVLYKKFCETNGFPLLINRSCMCMSVYVFIPSTQKN